MKKIFIETWDTIVENPKLGKQVFLPTLIGKESFEITELDENHGIVENKYRLGHIHKINGVWKHPNCLVDKGIVCKVGLV